MTIRNHDLWTVYHAARDNRLGIRFRNMAALADAAYEGMEEQAREQGTLNLAGDDRAVNFICDAFAFACNSNGLCWREDGLKALGQELAY